MSFGFGNAANNIPGAGQGPDLEVIQTEAIGFLSIAGDAKVRLTPPWPSESLPAATSCLLSIASRRGLVAAAGPHAVILATTQAVRKAFETPKDVDSDIRPFKPLLRLRMPARVSQLAFSADENFLLLSAELGGGLAIYEVETLLDCDEDRVKPIFEIGTNGQAVRALMPNPTREKAELCAIVTTEGNLHVANLSQRQIGPVLRPQVGCVSWSNKGKQLVAGLADGNMVQMTPEGEVKAEIPRPPNAGTSYASSLSWLENNLFLAIHTSSNQSPSTATYNIITRQPPSTYSYQKLTDPVDPFGSERLPNHSLLRLKDFAPNLQDLLIVASTASTDIGLLTRSKSPLASDKPAQSITGVFTTTELSDDTKRATLPMTSTYDDSIPIGTSLDLSSKMKVYKPIPTEEMEESPGPLPGFWLLTHEGVLCAWWIIYTDSIRQGLTYQGMAVIEVSAQETTTPSRAAASPFGTSSLATATAATPSPFGLGGATTPAFGSHSTLGTKQSPWGSNTSAGNTGAAVFGSSAFGGVSAQNSGGPAFGQSGFGAARTSPWATGSSTSAVPAFGSQSGFGALKSASSGGQSILGGSATPSTGGFANFASKGGFGALGDVSSGSSPFGNQTNQSVFGSGGDFAMDTDTSFPPVQSQEKRQSELPSTPFKLESSFKRDVDDNDASSRSANIGASGGGSFFGSGFGSALGEAAKEVPFKDEDMETEAPAETPKPMRSILDTTASTTPTTQPGSNLFGTKKAEPAGSGSLFGSGPASKSSGESESIFGSSTVPSQTGGLFGTPTTSRSVLSDSKSAEPAPDSSPFVTKLPTDPDRSSILFGSKTPAESTQTSSLFSSKSSVPAGSTIFNSVSKPFAGFSKQAELAKPTEKEEAKIKVEGEEKPLAEISAPPESTSKTTYPLEDSGSSSAASTPPASKSSETSTPGDAPLPPDSLTEEPVEDGDDATAPSGPAKASANIDDALLPPDFVPVSAAKGNSHPAIPSTTPLKPSEAFGQQANTTTPLPDLGDDRDDFSEGSGIDVGKELSQSSLESGPSPVASMRPGGTSTTQAEKPRPLFGEIGRQAPPLFPKLIANESPRSPSPVRGSILSRGIRSEASRSVSAPGMASQLLGARKSHNRVERPPTDLFSKQHREARARQQMDEMQPLVDEEDEELHQLLASDVDPTLDIDEFVAHTNGAPPARDGIPAQVEAVYRDVNSMIDTLGLNTRSLTAFVKGHNVYAKPDGRTLDDLEDPDGWVLSELSELARIICDDLTTELGTNHVQDLDGKLTKCQDLSREMSRLRAKQAEIRRLIAARVDPVQAEVNRSLPLSPEQAAQQADLRRGYTEFSRTLAETEEALTMLRAKIVSAAGASGGAGGHGTGKTQIPTVDAVVRTINKMTSIAEKRSGDVDVLENQIRKLRLAGGGSSISGAGSREGSPALTTPRKGVVRDSLGAGALATSMAAMSIMSPESPLSARRSGLRYPLSSGLSPARRKAGGNGTSGFSAEEKRELMERRTKRREMLAKLEEVVTKNGVNVWAMEVE